MSAELAITEVLDRRVLAEHDFDKTTHLTSEPLEGGHTVEEACEVAVGKVLGNASLEQYRVTGGLRNRAPAAVIHELLPTAESDYVRQLTEDFVEVKLDVLTPQIGTRMPDGRIWPPTNEGFDTYWLWAHQRPRVTTGITSSGHERFIRRAFDVHDLPHPDIFVTDDDMRQLMHVLPRHLCEKPSPLALDLSVNRWLEHLGIVLEQGHEFEALQTAKKQVVFIGDALEQDGGLARNAGVDFVHAAPSQPKDAFLQMSFLLMHKMGLCK